MSELSIVIVNYNTPQYTAHCLDSLLAQPPATTHEIIVVDNASADGSAASLAAQYPQIRLVRSATNLGIAGGNNLGIRASSGKYILLLNNDTLVTPGAIDRCVGFMHDRPDVAGVGGRILNEDGSFQGGFADFPDFRQVFLIVTRLGPAFRPYYPSLPPSREPRAVEWMGTAFMVFRADALRQVGMVDEDYFIYCDESDLQYRLKRAGWQIYYLPDVTTIHFGGKSLNPWRRRRMVYRGYLLFFTRHHGAARTAALRLLFAGVSFLKLTSWLAAAVRPKTRELARKEIQSNWSILRMSLRPGIEKP